jgi:hypothetical protein
MQNAKFKAMQYAKNFELELEKMHLDALNLYAKY